MRVKFEISHYSLSLYDSGDKVKEDVVAVRPYGGVVEGHLQLIHGLQQKTFSFILKVFKGGFLVAY